MTITFSRQTFDDFRDRDSGQIFSELVFDSCTFLDCLISKSFDPSLRSTIRSVTLRNCRARQGGIGTAIVEDTIVDGLKIDSVIFGWGAVFRHVTLRGRIDGQIILNSNIEAGGNNPSQAAFDSANARYYENVDWALDLSEANFNTPPSLKGVPARLIRRDPETQLLVTQERLEGADVGDLYLGPAAWEVVLQDIVAGRGRDCAVLIAPKRNSRFDEYMEALEVVRKNGWAE